MWMIVLYFLGYFNWNKQNSYAALNQKRQMSLSVVEELIQIGHVYLPLTFSILNLPSTTSRELLSQFSTCSGWRWLEVGDKWKNILLFLKPSLKIFVPKPLGFAKLSHFSAMQDDALMHSEDRL